MQLLCSRQITAVDYVEALYDRYESGGYECLNPFITYNISQVIDTLIHHVLWQRISHRLCRVMQHDLSGDICHVEPAGADCLGHLEPEDELQVLVYLKCSILQDELYCST